MTRTYRNAAITAALFFATAATVQASPFSGSPGHTEPQWVTFPAKGNRTSYRVEASLLVKDSQGKDVLATKWQEISRQLPPVGTTWVYLYRLQHRTHLKLMSVHNGKAYYDVDEGNKHMTEDAATYHRVGQPKSQRLPFPLHPGDHWDDKYKVNYRIPALGGGSYPVTEQGYVYSKVVGVSKVHVPAGTFVAYAIDRRINWAKEDTLPKDNPQHLQHPLRGFTREMMWYAPKAGRVVLQGRMTAGMAIYLRGEPEDFMRNADVSTIELEDMVPAGQGKRGNVSTPLSAN